MKRGNLKKRIYTSLGLLIFTFLIAGYNFILIFGLLILGILSILKFLILTKKIFKNQFGFFSLNFLFIVYIFIFCLLFFYFSNFLQLKIILFSLLLSCAASDIGGFIFGNLFKGPKLTKISPKNLFRSIRIINIFRDYFFEFYFFFYKQI